MESLQRSNLELMLMLIPIGHYKSGFYKYMKMAQLKHFIGLKMLLLSSETINK